MVYIVNDGRKIISCRSGDNNLLCACCDMSRSFLFGCVEAGALQNYIYSKLSPRKILSVFLSVDLDGLAINCDAVLASAYSLSQSVFTL